MSEKNYSRIFIALALVLSLSATPMLLVEAAVPTKSIAFHGQLSTAGSAVSGSKSISFQFYDASSGGAAVGSLITKTATVSAGYFSVVFSASDLSGIDFNQSLWIGITVEGDVLSPRISINSVPSSLNTFGLFSYASAPSVGSAGAVYYNTGDSKTYVSNGSAWVELGGSQWTTTGSDVYYNTGNVGIGTTTPGSKLVVAGQIIADNYVALSTTATSTFAGPVTLASHCIAIETRFRRRKKNEDGSGDDTEEEVDLASLKIGDYVESFDEATQTVVFKKIENIFAMGIKPIIKIDTDKGYSIKTTEEHPYYSKKASNKNGSWVKVRDLSVGDSIAVIDTATRLVDFDTISHISNLPEEDVYDLEIEGTHTFVANNIVAHNTYVQGGLGVGVLNTSAGTFALKQASTNAVILGDVSGNARGSYALDLQSGRTLATQVATGTCSTTVGFGNTASLCRSTALGLCNTASNVYSQALGSRNIASCGRSSAAGFLNTASGCGASAFGNVNNASGVSAVAVGYNNTASGYNSSALGNTNTASAYAASVFGFSNTASRCRATALGYYNTASGYCSTAVGYRNTASNNYSSAFGSCINNSTANSVEIGPANTEKLRISADGVNFITAGAGGFFVNGVAVGGGGDVNALATIQVGCANTASGDYSSALGYGNTTSGNYSSAVGLNNIASGQCSSALGYTNTASAYYSSAFGFCNNANGRGSSAVGGSNTACYCGSSALGYTNSASLPFASAVGSLNSASNYFTSAIGYGNTASSCFSSAFGYCNTVSAECATAIGSFITNSTTNSVEIGALDTEKLQISANGVNFVTAGAGGFCVNGVAVGGGGGGDVNALSVVAVGKMNSSSGYCSVAFGFTNLSCGSQSSAIGVCSNACNNRATAVGFGSTASGYWSTAVGYCSNAGATFSSAVGFCNNAVVACTSAFGMANTVSGYSSSAFGYRNTASGNGSTASGYYGCALSCGSSVFGYRNTASGYNYSSAVGACLNNLLCQSTMIGFCAGWLNVQGTGEVLSSTGACLTSGGTWTNASDRNLKENFVAVDKEDILAKINSLPLTKWNYKKEDSSIMHIGPMAQDFYAIFGLGNSDKSVSTIDPAGVALVGVQALSEKVDNLYVELGLLATSTDMNASQGGVLGWIKALGVTVVDGVAHFVNVVVGKITASDLTIKNESDVHKTGYVIYDRATGAPLCVFFENGIQKTEPGECDDVPQTSGTPGLTEGNNPGTDSAENTETSDSVENDDTASNDPQVSDDSTNSDTVVESPSNDQPNEEPVVVAPPEPTPAPEPAAEPAPAIE